MPKKSWLAGSSLAVWNFTVPAFTPRTLMTRYLIQASRRFPWLCTFILAALAVFAATGAPAVPAAQTTALTIVQDGQPKAALVLGDSLTANDSAAATLLAHIQRMSGAALPVLTAKDFSGARVDAGRIVAPEGKTSAQNFILLGESELTKQLGISSEGIGQSGVVMKTAGNAVVLLGLKGGATGKRDNVNANAVYNFLESLGCRFLWPGEAGKVIPAKSTISVAALDVRFTPPIGQRNIRFTPLVTRGSAQGLAWLGVTPEDQRAAFEAASRVESEGSWGSWNGLGGNIGIVGGAAGCGLRGGWDQWGKEHPEWFALQADGTRDQSLAKERWRLCVSNPGLIEHVAQDIITRLNGHAQAAISLCPNDGGFSSFCMCDECRKLDAKDGPKIKMLIFDKVGGTERKEVDYVSLTDRYVHYWNAVAERVTKVVPDQLFLVEAYSYYSDPPVHEKLHPNLVVRYVPGQADGWKGWQAAGAKRAYWRPNNLGSGYRYGGLNPKAREAAETLNYLGQNGVLATDMDSIFNNWATAGLVYYVSARLNWNPALKFDDVLDDYCATGFGAGAGAVKKYFLAVEKGVVPVVVNGRGSFPHIAPETIAELRALLTEAAKATESDAPSHKRVAFLRAGLEFSAVSAEAYRMAEAAAENSGAVDAKAAATVLERRWQMMRALIRNQPLAVNMAVVAGNDAPLNSALGWKGPSEIAKNGKFQLQAGDDWLNEDQSATRKGSGK
jgi:hypothetical protein